MNSKIIFMLVPILIAGFNQKSIAEIDSKRIIVTSNKSILKKRTLVFDLGFNTVIELQYAPTGSFKYLAPSKKTGVLNVKKNSKNVKIKKEFWIGKYEVTRRQMLVVFNRYKPDNDNNDQLDRPVSFVSHDEALYFCDILNKRYNESGILKNNYEFRLPTEVEWEYACLSGKNKVFGVGDGERINSNLANFNGNYPFGENVNGPTKGKSVAVGSYKGNAWGIHDMHGNVWEWCLEGFSDSKLNYRAANFSEKIIASVMRGGGWTSSGRYCKSSSRIVCLSNLKRPNLGFRIILSPLIKK